MVPERGSLQYSGVAQDDVDTMADASPYPYLDSFGTPRPTTMGWVRVVASG